MRIEYDIIDADDGYIEGLRDIEGDNGLDIGDGGVLVINKEIGVVPREGTRNLN